MRRLIQFCVVLGLSLALALPTPGAGRPADGQQAKPRNFEVRMVAGNKFDAKDIEIQAGDTVTWINASGMPHSATADDDSELKFDEEVVQGGKFSKRVTFDKKGTAKYHCKFHAVMTGTITIK